MISFLKEKQESLESS